MKVLVTGGAGFIGSHLAERFDADVVDNLSTGTTDNLDKQERLIATSILDVDVKEYDVVIHAGMPSTSAFYTRDPQPYMKSIEEMAHILDAQAVIYVSTSSVYSIPGIFSPVSNYATFKAYLEEWGRKNASGKFIVVRPFSIFGEREQSKGKFANVLTQMIWAKLNDEPFIIYGSGVQTRDFTHVENVCNAIDILLRNIDKADRRVFDIATGVSHTFNEVAQMVGCEVEYNQAPYPESYIKYQCAKIVPLRKMGYKPITLSQQLVKKVEKYYEEVRNWPKK